MGFNGSLPWPHSKEDMMWFKNHTTGHVVVMGRKSWMDPNMKRPLPNRVNVVLSSSPHDWADVTVSSIDQIVNLQKQFPDKIIWICGGESLLLQTRHLVSKAFVTIFDNKFECDTFIDLKLYLQNATEKSRIQGDRKSFLEYDL
jgi:dihydrofolate reductase